MNWRSFLSFSYRNQALSWQPSGRNKMGDLCYSCWRFRMIWSGLQVLDALELSVVRKRYGNRSTRRIRGWNPCGKPWAEDVACQDFKLEAETAMKIIEDPNWVSFGFCTTETCSTLSVFQSCEIVFKFHQMFPVLKGSWMIECQFFLAFFVSPKFQPQPFLGRWPWRIVSEEYASFGRDLGQIWRRVSWIQRIWRHLEKHGVSVEN